MKYGNVKGEFPGKQAKTLLERREKAIPRGVSNGVPTFAAKAEGEIIGNGSQGACNSLKELSNFLKEVLRIS